MNEFGFSEVLETISDTVPEATALICGDTRRTWREFEQRSARLAAALAARDITAGAKIAVYLHNCNEYAEAHFAAFKSGICPINVNYRYQADELAYLLDNSDSEALIYHGDFVDQVEKIRLRLPKLKLLIQVEDASGNARPTEVSDYEQLLQEQEPAPRQSRPPSDLYMLYTGGTTGIPKGVMYHVGDFCRTLCVGFPARGLPLPEKLEQFPELIRGLHETGIAPLAYPACPQMHATGLWLGTFMPLIMGGQVVTPVGTSYEPNELLRDIEQHKITDLVIVGDPFARPMLTALNEASNRSEPYDISSLTFLISSGAMWSAEVKQGLLEHHDMILYDAMGSTEGSMGASISDRATSASTARFSLGAGVKVFNENDREVLAGSGEIGLLASSELVPLGYYKDDEKSTHAFREVGGVRYSFPGDYARVEANGEITLLGRGNQCVNTAGEKVFTEEVEEAVKRHPTVEDCLVTGAPDEFFGERVVALVSLAKGQQSVPDEELREFMRDTLASYKLPKMFVYVDQVQRAPNGKADYIWAKTAAIEAAGQAM